jgi:hypothetical protein
MRWKESRTQNSGARSRKGGRGDVLTDSDGGQGTDTPYLDLGLRQSFNLFLTARSEHTRVAAAFKVSQGHSRLFKPSQSYSRVFWGKYFFVFVEGGRRAVPDGENLPSLPKDLPQGGGRGSFQHRCRTGFCPGAKIILSFCPNRRDAKLTPVQTKSRPIPAKK